MRTGEQTATVLRLLEPAFGDALVRAWLHGSALLGSLRPTSDIDILAMVEVAPDHRQRRSLLRGSLDVSVHPDDPMTGRPVELSVVVRSDVVPWRYPSTVTFQYGEWLRPEYEDGVVPGVEVSSDLALLTDVARRADDSPASQLHTNRSSSQLGTTTSARERRTGHSVSTRLETSPPGA